MFKINQSLRPVHVRLGERRELLASLILVALVSFLAVSNQSLWIDEALTAWKAKQPTLTTWWQAMSEEKASDLQMPLYMIYIWAYEKVFGASEWALRSANVPWFLLGLIAFAAAFSASPRQRLMGALAVAASPFAWYYVNEARPYAMQLGASLLIFAAVYRLSGRCNILPNCHLEGSDASSGKTDSHGSGSPETAQEPREPVAIPRSRSATERFWVRGLLVGIVTLCGSSMLGMIWAAAAVVAMLVVFSQSRIKEMLRACRWSCVLAFGCVLLSGCYYLWTLRVGARASGAAITDWKNLLFIGYELLGFSGLGPGRLEIRERGFGVFQSHWIGLTLYSILVLLLLSAAIRQLWSSHHRKMLLKLGLVVAMPAFILVSAGVALHFRLLGRHFAPLMPVVLFLLSLGLVTLWSQRRQLARVMVGSFFVLSLLSGLLLRFAARHEKDNYRDAAAFARLALQGGQKVWWNAERQGAAYYQIPTMNTQSGEVGQALWLMNPSWESLRKMPVPDVIVASKPDVFDNQGALARYIEQLGFKKTASLAAFTVWNRVAD